MAVIRQAEAQRIATDAIVLDLGDLRRQGEQIKALAAAEARAILAAAQAERQRLLSGAREEGHAQGLAEGRGQGLVEGKESGHAAALAAGREQLAKLEAGWQKALDEFTAARDGILLEARQGVVRLGALIGECITRRKIEVDSSVVAAQVEAVLALIARPTRLVIAVHPADEALAREALPGLLARFPCAEHAELAADETLDRGSCLARSASGAVINADIRVQIDRIVHALLPGGAS